jgi:GNAT superfamily N-acetyltransferase
MARRGRGNKWQPSVKDRELVKRMTGAGITQEQLCLVLDVTRPTLERACRRELDRGLADAIDKVSQSMFTMATKGRPMHVLYQAAAFWQRILAPDGVIGCLLARRAGNDPIGFANYVLHPHTWSLQSVCYLEDMFVLPESRGRGAGRVLIEGLIALGKQQSWRRIYWHGHETIIAPAPSTSSCLGDWITFGMT